MNLAEKVTALAGQLYDARRVVRSLQGQERFHALVAKHRPLLEAVAEQQKTNILGALTHLLRDMKANNASGLEQVIISAVAAEIISPSQD